MTESAIKSNQREAARLFERGVAAARGGQRRVAAGLLARAVQLDPRHEMGWLWLSGVLDEPNEIAFCLRSVLAVNPHNDRARQGLAWLEERGKIIPQPAPASVLAPPAEAEHADEQRARHEGESWWVNWRRSRREMGRARLVFWSVPILLLTLTLGLNLALRDAISRNTQAAVAAAQPKPVATARPALPALIHAESPASADSRALAYLSALNDSRARLREAIGAYRNSTSQPGGSSVAHAAAARKLRELIDATHSRIETIAPPPALVQAHNSYLAGLEIERLALDDMLEFYNGFRVQFANRATLRMVDAGRQLERALALFEQRQTQATQITVPVQTAR
ncbi:MAG TPA: hypothetical protein VKE41_00240 [Roseiflexaceae bacterium]|nr:hypothetical protein [Roseiflexaceae bacterium]